MSKFTTVNIHKTSSEMLSFKKAKEKRKIDDIFLSSNNISNA